MSTKQTLTSNRFCEYGDYKYKIRHHTYDRTVTTLYFANTYLNYIASNWRLIHGCRKLSDELRFHHYRLTNPAAYSQHEKKKERKNLTGSVVQLLNSVARFSVLHTDVLLSYRSFKASVSCHSPWKQRATLLIQSFVNVLGWYSRRSPCNTVLLERLTDAQLVILYLFNDAISNSR